MSPQTLQPVVGGVNSDSIGNIVSNDIGNVCMYNVTFRRVRVTTVDVEKQKVLRIQSVCS
jgi:hypothetical protein